jgi:hypothetical protein
MTGPLDASPPRPAGWRAWLRRAAHHFLPEDQVRTHEGRGKHTGPSDAATAGRAAAPPETPESLDHVLRTALEARTAPEDDDGGGGRKDPAV